MKDQEIERLNQQVLELTKKLNERVISEDLKTQSNETVARNAFRKDS